MSMPPIPRYLRHRLKYAGFLLIAGLMTALPVEWASALSGRILRFFGPLSRKYHRLALEDLAKAYPDVSEAERSDLALAVWENLGRVFGEYFHLQEIVQERIVCENPEVLAQLVESGGGSVGCAAHQANWEIAAAILVKHGLNPMGVYQPVTNPFFDAYLKRHRKPFYPGGLLAKMEASTPRKMLHHVRSGATAAFLVDQWAESSEGSPAEVRAALERAKAQDSAPAPVAEPGVESINNGSTRTLPIFKARFPLPNPRNSAICSSTN